jgi:trehalose-6-phosphate synthase
MADVGDSQVALYRAADCMIITSVRDGMNLMAYEFVACQKVPELLFF